MSPDRDSLLDKLKSDSSELFLSQASTFGLLFVSIVPGFSKNPGSLANTAES